MILVNFSHPLRPAAVAEVESHLAVGTKLEIVNIPVHVDIQSPLPEQVGKLIDRTKEAVGGTLLNVDIFIPPGLSSVAVLLSQQLPKSAGMLVLSSPAGVIPPSFMPCQFIREGESYYFQGVKNVN